LRLFLIALGLCWSPGLLYAQWGDSVQVKSSIESSVLWDIGSNSFSIQNYRDFVSTDFLTPSFKNELIDASNDNLRFGSRQSFAFAYRQVNDSIYGNWAKGFEIRISYKSVFGISGQKDALSLILNGNSPYAGQTLELGPSRFQNQSFLSLGFRMVEEREKWNYAYGLSALFGTQFQDLKMENGTLFTEESGSYIDANTNYVYRNADTLNPIKGMGLSVGGLVERALSKQLSVGLELSDFGIIFWNNASYTVQADTSFRYEGEFIPNLLDFEGSLFEDTQQDLDASLLTKEGGSFVALTPFILKANAVYLHKDLGKLKSSEALIEYLYTAGFSPLFRLNSTWRFKRWSVTPDLSYGGFTTFGGGISTAYESRFWKAKLHIFNAQGLLSSNSKAVGAQVSFFYAF
jgi:hypothetical protein